MYRSISRMIFVSLLPMLKAESCDGNVSENKDYQQCETTANLQYIECTNSCQDNPACLSDCSRNLVDEIKLCPCMEGKYTLTDKKTCSIKGCPDGCPCPVYTCPSIKSSVLVLSTWTRINRPLVVDFAGNYHRIDFRIERTKEVFRSCSDSGCSFTEVTLPDLFLKLGLISRTKLLGITE